MAGSGEPPAVSHAPGGSGTFRVDWRAGASMVGTVLRYLSVALLVPLAA